MIVSLERMIATLYGDSAVVVMSLFSDGGYSHAQINTGIALIIVMAMVVEMTTNDGVCR